MDLFSRTFLALLVAWAISFVTFSSAEKNDLDGEWLVKSITIDGKKIDAKLFADAKIVVEGNRFTFWNNNKKTGMGTFTLDKDKKPAEMDIITQDGKGDKTKVLAIYQIKGDRLTVCGAPPGKQRPQQFQSKANSGMELVEYQRKKQK